MNREEYKQLQNALKKHLSYNEMVDISVATDLPLAPPIRASLRVTARCNSDCSYCPYRKSLSRERVDISLETLRNTIDSLAELGVKLLFLSGGEPLLRNDITDICAHAHNRGMIVQLSTNGLLLTQSCALGLSDAGLRHLIMSLDSLEVDIYASHRGVNNKRISETLDTLSYFAQLKPDNSSAVTFVVSQKNYRELPGFIHYIEAIGNGCIGVNIQPFHDSRFTRNPELRPNPDDELAWKEIMEQVVTLKSEGFHINVRDDYLRHIPAFIFHNAPQEGPCMTGFMGIFITENLDAVPCWKFPAIGNLNDKSALDIWLSEPYSVSRHRMLHRDCDNCMLMCHTGLGDWANYLYNPINFHHQSSK